VLLLAAALSGCRESGDAAAHAVPQYTIEDFMATTALTGASFSPDESKVLVSSDQTGIFNAFAVPVDGSAPVQLTSSTTNAVMARSFFPKDERFLYESDQGGNELTHVYVHELDGSATDLTPGDKLKAAFESWAHDHNSFFLTTNERDNRYFDLYEVAADGYERTLVYKNDDGYDIGPISRDKRYVALVKTHTNSNSDVYLLDRSNGAVTHLTPHSGDVVFEPAEFDADGRSLYLITDEGDEFRYLVRQDLASGARQTVVKPGWDVMDARLSDTGKYLVLRVNQDARTAIQVVESGSLKPVALPHLPDGDITTVVVAPSETRLAFYLDGNRSPANLYVHELGQPAARQLTRSLSPKVDPEHLVDAQVVRFPSYDGVPIPGLLYRPHAASPKHKVPALVWVHGGPGGQSRVGYSPLIQYMVNSGYAVYAINNRGSSGYGKSFYAMDDRNHGGADLDDCVASKKLLTDQGYVNPERIGIVGGSYGGYMVLAALAFRPEEFALGVDLFGISNWVRTLESIPTWWEAQRVALYKELGDPQVDHEYLRSISPLFHADQIRRPLMVLQGANDPRVLKVESDEIVQAVRGKGAVAEYIVFDDEGHGFRKKANRVRGYKAIRDFCDAHLKPAADGVAER
jgi:dipeptidyl aminopeptidase/acylaminoacyl peptidase